MAYYKIKVIVFIYFVYSVLGHSAITQQWLPREAWDMENWMKWLPKEVREESIIYLAIPGSHNSMSYGMTESSDQSPDYDGWLINFWSWSSLRGTVLSWARTQSADVTEQLKMGIRYFDLRIATKRIKNKFYFVHGLYAEEITLPLKKMKKFLDAHPQEVVILDFQHFYSSNKHKFNETMHAHLVSDLIIIFGAGSICPRKNHLDSITLANLQKLGQQLIIIYRDDSMRKSRRIKWWLSEQLVTPWPRQTTIEGLQNFLDQVERDDTVGFVHQAILTPNTKFIATQIFYDLRSSCARPVLDHIIPHVQTMSVGHPPLGKVNVVIADFVEMDNGKFAEAIVQMNYKMCDFTLGVE